MRKEASIEQWKELYEAATRLQVLEPWGKFWDLDIIGVRKGAEEDTVFYSILGRGGSCYGISVYEGYEAFNSFMMMTLQGRLHLPSDFVMYSQRCLTCYWGNREELTDKQRNVIKELGYKYRGKNQWLYFLSLEPGYTPYNLEQEEVNRMTEHLRNLETALGCYEKLEAPVGFEREEMFCLELAEDGSVLGFGAKPLPFASFHYGNLQITDEELLAQLEAAPKCDVVLEMDVMIPGASVDDKKYKKPANVAMCMIVEAVSEMILRCEMQEPDDDVIVTFAQELVGFILQVGAPKEIRVSNLLIEAGLEQICQICGIKLRRVKCLNAIEECKREMLRFMS